MVGQASTDRLASLRAGKDLMDASFAAELDLDQVAAAAGYSTFHFARAFQEAYGGSPGRYLTRRRIEALGWEPAYVDALCGLFTAIRDGWAAGVSGDVATVLGRRPRTAAILAAGRTA